MVGQPVVGRLESVPLPLVIRECYLRKLSGVLDLHLAHEQRRIFLFEGEVRSARSNRVEQKVGQHSVRVGLITSDQLREALSCATPGTPLGQQLVKLGFVAEATLAAQLKEMVKQIIFECFGWANGEYRFYEGTPMLPPELEIRVPTADIVFHGFKRFAPETLARKLIGNLDAILIPNPNLRLLFQHVTLDPTEGFILTRINGGMSTNQIVGALPGDRRQNLITLGAFVACGLASVRGTEQAPAIPDFFPRLAEVRPDAAASAGQPQAGTGAQPGAQPAAQPGAAQPPRPRRPVRKLIRRPEIRQVKFSAEDVEKLRRSILKKYQGLAHLNYYQLLDLPFRATQKEIHYAFMYMGAMYHPDMATKEARLADLKKQMEEIFSKLELAYVTLVDVEKRKKYDRGFGY